MERPHESTCDAGAVECRSGLRCDAAAVLCAIVGVLYLILLFLVSAAEAAPGATDSNTYGAYLFVAIPYLVGTVLLVAFDRRPLYVIGAALQVFVIALFVVFGIGMFGPGVFEYGALSHLRIGIWAAGITVAQVILFGLLCYLALTPASLRGRVGRRNNTWRPALLTR